MPEYLKGGLNEPYPWKIEFDYVFAVFPGYDDKTVCGHCIEIRPGHPRWEERHRSDRQLLCPRVVVALCQAGYDGTTVCLDCILEAAAGLERL